MTTHDRVHARKPTHDLDRWDRGTVERLVERDGHCLVTVTNAAGESVDLRVTLAVRDLFVGRLDLPPGASPVGETVWYRKKGGR
ncbi:DUF7861 family protein [Halomarina ordinaria]|uniref:Uncharacterized protein n=1 Tax=Halomarina ordinaria TaxID=3033939 RepID=A0ABD5U714_9EURY|nr:hypothetical protein [Halomarina sp. PSRA2]